MGTGGQGGARCREIWDSGMLSSCVSLQRGLVEKSAENHLLSVLLMLVNRASSWKKEMDTGQEWEWEQTGLN